jgi:hypothetical protein
MALPANGPEYEAEIAALDDATHGVVTATTTPKILKALESAGIALDDLNRLLDQATTP